MHGCSAVKTGILAGAVVALLGGWGQQALGRDEPLPDRPAQSNRVSTESFSALDGNKDGVLSPQEARESTVLGGRFADADANRDGSIDRSEFAAYELLRENDNAQTAPPGRGGSGRPGSDQTPPSGAAPGDALFKGLDRDDNGQLSRAEAQEFRSLTEGFDKADQNGDGDISRSEFSAFEQATNGAPPNTLSPSRSQQFEHLDRNGDGVVSYGEAAAQPGLYAKFGDADTNLDGQLDRGEFAAFIVARSVNPPEIPGHGGRPIIEEPPPER